MAAALLGMPGAGASAGASLLVSPSRIAAVADFSATFRGYWWDFGDETRFAVEDSREGFLNPRVSGGWWVATSAIRPQSGRADGTVRLSHLNIDGPEPTNWAPSEFRHLPLDPDYHYLTYRMCSSASAGLTMVRWHADASKADGDFGGTVFRRVRQGCRLYRFDLAADRNPQVGSLAWGAEPAFALEILPVSEPGVDIRLDFVTLSSRRQGPRVEIAWQGLAEPVRLYFAGVDGSRTLIRANRTGGDFTWRTPGLAPGTYRVIAVSATGQTLAAAENLVVDCPPAGRILNPSATSGPDYAAEVVGDPWDFSNPADVERALGLVPDSNLGDGVYDAVSIRAPGPSGDPRLFLHVTRPIDPHRYHYLTYRMWVGGNELLPGTGGVSRVFWFREGSWDVDDCSFTQDLRVYQGWRTVTIDLAGAYLQGDDIGTWGRTPVTDLRLDPHESPIPRAFHLDWVTLTGDVVADDSFRVRYQAVDPDGGTPVARLFYDTDRRATGGAPRTPIACVPDPGHPAAGSCLWRTAGVAEGEYFIHLLVTDALGNQAWATSEVPLLVRHP